MIISQKQERIPNYLFHHTSIEACKSILSDIDNHGVCFWVVSNKHKNDENEIKMGEYILKHMRSAIPYSSILRQFGNYENSASLSFMEGESTVGMLKKYGNIRMEFNLNGYISQGLFSDGLMKCEYVKESELEDYAVEYCNLAKKIIQNLNNSTDKGRADALNNLSDICYIINDVIHKVFTIKEDKWSEEKEWRLIRPLTNQDIKHTKDGKPYIEYFLPKESLIGLTILYEKYTPEVINEKAQLEAFFKDKKYQIPIRLLEL